MVSVTTISHHGNIPAYAGRTVFTDPSMTQQQKHPRIRGENSVPASDSKKAAETSPHTRGEHMTDIYTNDRLRNIPAYAGRTDTAS